MRRHPLRSAETRQGPRHERRRIHGRTLQAAVAQNRVPLVVRSTAGPLRQGVEPHGYPACPISGATWYCHLALLSGRTSHPACCLTGRWQCHLLTCLHSEKTRRAQPFLRPESILPSRPGVNESHPLVYRRLGNQGGITSWQTRTVSRGVGRTVEPHGYPACPISGATWYCHLALLFGRTSHPACCLTGRRHYHLPACLHRKRTYRA
jgi:hypothetical protein